MVSIQFHTSSSSLSSRLVLGKGISVTNDSDLVQFGGVYRTSCRPLTLIGLVVLLLLKYFVAYRYHGKCVLVVNSESWDQE